jgi:hypothetical protein
MINPIYQQGYKIGFKAIPITNPWLFLNYQKMILWKMGWFDGKRKRQKYYLSMHYDNNCNT